MNRNHRRAADRPSTSKAARYDRDKELAANLILKSPEQHNRFQIDWARLFQRRRAEESTKPERNENERQGWRMFG